MRVNVLHVRVVLVTPGSTEMSQLPFFLHLHLLVMKAIGVVNNIKWVLFLQLFLKPFLLTRNRSKHKKAEGRIVRRAGSKGDNLRETNPWMIFSRIVLKSEEVSGFIIALHSDVMTFLALAMRNVERRNFPSLSECTVIYLSCWPS